MDPVPKKLSLIETGRIHSFGFWLGIFIVAILADQWSKWFAQQHWSIFRNDDFAFSIPIPEPIMFGLYAVVMILVVWYIKKIWHTITDQAKLGWVLIIAGGVANIVERIVLGYVRDFLYIANGVFNVADLCIFAGVIIVLIMNRERTK